MATAATLMTSSAQNLIVGVQNVYNSRSVPAFPIWYGIVNKSENIVREFSC